MNLRAELQALLTRLETEAHMLTAEVEADIRAKIAEVKALLDRKTGSAPTSGTK